MGNHTSFVILLTLLVSVCYKGECFWSFLTGAKSIIINLQIYWSTYFYTLRFIITCFGFPCSLMVICSTVSLVTQNTSIIQLNIYIKQFLNIWDVQLLISVYCTWHLGFVETPTTIKQEYQEPRGLKDARNDVDINDCKLSWIILANSVNGMKEENII